jgi:hypothetical protein
MKKRIHRTVSIVLAGLACSTFSLVSVAGAATSAAAAAPPTLSVTPSALSFVDTTLGAYTEKQFTVSNETGTTVTLTYFDRSGANGNDFTVVVDNNAECPDYDTSTGNVTLQSGHSCVFGVRFFPSALGARSATLTLTSNGSQVPGTSINVSGTGTIGYYQVSSDGSIGYAGDANFWGDLSGTSLNSPIVGMSQVGNNGGYWLTAADGGVFSFGPAAQFYGSAGSLRLNKPVVGMAALHYGGGYWLVATDGGIFAYGNAQFYGSTGGMTLNKPIVDMAATNDGNGYWLVASDGGIFAYGDAQFYGSTGGIALNQPVVGMAPTPDDGGYWLVAADGGIFAYGDAQFYGSAGNLHLVKPITAMAVMPDGNGYWFSANDGGLFAYGDAPFYGSGNSNGLTDVVGMAISGEATVQAQYGGSLPFARSAAVPREGWSSTLPPGQLEVSPPLR